MLVDTIEYRDHQIEIHRDFSPSNPFEDWDCEVPILVAYLDHARLELHSYGVDDELPHLERPVVLAHWRDILAELNLRNDWQGLLSFAREELKYPYDPLDRALAQALDDDYRDRNASDKLELLERVYGWMGVTAVLGSTTGYCQGAYAKVLAVATPEWVKKTGAPPESHKAQCEYAIKLYGYWAWGDVYGYVIDGDGDSCWGFYGDDHEESGLLEQAQNEIDCLLRQESIDKDTEALTCD
jgi:hypothetical protein